MASEPSGGMDIVAVASSNKWSNEYTSRQQHAALWEAKALGFARRVLEISQRADAICGVYSAQTPFSFGVA